MDYLPIFMDLRGKRCLLVGAGEVASRKAALLVRAGVHLVVVAPDVRDDIRTLVEELKSTQGAELHQREFREQDMEDVALVVAATADRDVNRQVSELAHARNLPVNAVDQPELCSFIMPAIVDRSPVLVAISTGGNSPMLTRHLKEQMDLMLPAGYGRLATLLGELRDRVKTHIGDFRLRSRFWEHLLAGTLPELVFSGRREEALQVFEHSLTTWHEESVQGEVYLVGAGPGDPDLLTLKALRLLYAADVVLYDRLVAPAILERVRPDAERIFVGKSAKNHPVPQEEINDLLIRLAREGHRVVRLKGGDPFVFGRGGEEIDKLAQANIPFQVVPGITSASGCASYAGIPLTHRDFAQSVTFVTGHTKHDQPDLNWAMLAQEKQTVVIYMGLLTLRLIVDNLMTHGMASDMPVAVVEKGTTPEQRVITGALNTIAAKVEQAEVGSPALIIIGRVVTLHRQLAWFGESTQAPDPTALPVPGR